jgi:hypothetical protein
VQVCRLLFRPAKYEMALVGTKVCKYEHFPDASSGLCMTWH